MIRATLRTVGTLAVLSIRQGLEQHGGSSHAWIHIADVPCLCDSSTVGGISELNGAIVINLANCIGSPILWLTVLAMRVILDHNSIAHSVGVLASSHVFALIFLKDKLLLAILYVLPVCLE